MEFYLIDQPNLVHVRNLPVYERNIEVNRLLNITDPYVVRLMNESNNPLTNCLTELLNDKSEGDTWKLSRWIKDHDTARRQHIKDYVPEVYSCIEDMYIQIPTATK